MPRTKVPKNAPKRVRDADDLVETKMKEFDCAVKFGFEEIEYQTMQGFSVVEKKISNFLSGIPTSIQEMTIGELKKLNLATFAEVAEHLTKMDMNMSVMHTSIRIPTADEGYLTEASCSSRKTVSSSKRSVVRATPMLGPLSSARARPRQSRSAGNLQTPSVLHSIKAKRPPPRSQAKAMPEKRNTLDESHSSSLSHASRSKYRTADGRQKAASADRVITPKVQLGTPLSILRYPRMGETLISTTGSPVAGMPAMLDMANIAIPLTDGVISVRPTSISEFDPEILRGINPKTLSELKKLQQNLNKVLENFQKD